MRNSIRKLAGNGGDAPRGCFAGFPTQTKPLTKLNFSHHLVLPSDLNQFGFLFGGRLLAWVDEASWITASLDFPHCQFVTIGMDRVEFRYGVSEGTILCICCKQERKGTTSVTYSVEVTNGKKPHGPPLFSTQITFVSVNDQGQKRAI